MPNHLANETSPYLLQHANNPVNWYPWGEEALQKARLEDKPILLSIGYAACHWCHVMAHESFENEAVAQMMNAWFVNIKVDREERPDLDHIYMQAVVSVTGQGGWPMTVFLTPEGRPFFGGTYFPPTQRYGMPAFSQVLQSVAAAWRDRREEVNHSADQIMNHLQHSMMPSVDLDAQALAPSLIEASVQQLAQRFDSQWGGFSPAPKFPQPMVIEFLLREHHRKEDQQALDMAQFTLEKMAHGGMYDHLGGGFARYSTDERWLVPHFEKMLYDNAQLARVYLHAWQVTRKPLFRRVVEETLDYILREMTHSDGGFYSSMDADSEGVEGKFYVWSQQEIKQILGDDAELFSQVYDVTRPGNWEGKNILHIEQTLDVAAEKLGINLQDAATRLEAARQKLFVVRQERIAPGLDDKVLTSWNGLAMAAFAEAGSILERQDYLQAANKNAEFIYRTMRTENGRLMRTWKAGGTASHNAFLEDYAFMADGLLALYQADFDPRWFEWARSLADQMLTHFQDRQNGGFFDTSDDHEQLIQRPKDIEDNAIPSGNARAAHVLLQLSLFTGDESYRLTGEQTVRLVSGLLNRYPFGFGEWLCAASLAISQPQEVALIGERDGLAPFLKLIRSAYRPFMVMAAGLPGENNSLPLLADRGMVDSQPTAYVCRNFVCRAPVTNPSALAAQLGDA